MKKYKLEKFEKDELVLWYKGAFENAITDLLIDIAESNLNDKNYSKSRKRIYFLMAESFQNIIRHGSSKLTSISRENAFSIRNKNGGFHIFSSNYIAKKTAVLLNEKLNQINQFNSKELKDFYLDVLTNGNFSDKGGAGLGLIEMARKSDHPIQYDLKTDDDKCEFSMQIDKDLLNDKLIANLNISETIEFNTQLNADGIVLLFYGDFDLENSNSIVNILLGNMQIDNANTKDKLIFHAGVEMLQNITRHGAVKNNKNKGLFILAIKENQVIMTTKNYVMSEHQSSFKQHLDEINSKSNEELSVWYKTRLKESTLEENNNAGVGLIDIGKIICDGFQYSFDNTSLGIECTLEVKIDYN